MDTKLKTLELLFAEIRKKGEKIDDKNLGYGKIYNMKNTYWVELREEYPKQYFLLCGEKEGTMFCRIISPNNESNWIISDKELQFVLKIILPKISDIIDY